MCGIAGVIGPFADHTTDEKFSGALDLLHHRGPDDRGMRRECAALLGHTRLAILDLSPKGHQPMVSSDGRYTLVFNGEIYNFRHLRKELSAEGIRFTSSGDTEVLLAAMIRWGIDALSRLNGMFAFAFYDRLDARLILARDRFGVKPLFYQDAPLGLLFASEIKPLRLLLNGQALNNRSAGHYLKLGFNYAPDTIWQHIHRLPAGSYLLHQSGRTEIGRWYAPGQDVEPLNCFRTASEKITADLEEAVRCRMISDVPMGAFLSGGIDSSLIVGLMRKVTNGDIKTFTVTYKNAKRYDESAYARLVSNHYGTQHHELEITMEDARAMIPAVLNHLDEPFADPSLLPTFLICKEIRKHITVALSGDGADEGFAGYRKYLGEHYMNQWWAPWAGPVLKYPLMLLPASRRNGMTEQIRKAKRFLSGMDPDPVNRCLNWMSLLPDDLIGTVVPFPVDRSEHIRDKIRQLHGEISGPDHFNRVLYTDQSLVLEGNMLPKVDMMSMFNALEVRSPFMDYRVIRTANAMPGHFKLNNTTGKYILKKAFKNLLPAEIRGRKKQGFDIPIGEWFRNDCKDLFWDAVNTAHAKRGIDRRAVEPIYKDHVNEVYDHTRILWSLFVWSWWWNRHF